MYKTIYKQIASLQIILGMVILVPSIVSGLYGEWYSCTGFLFSGLLITLIGYLGYRVLKNTDEPQYKHALVIVALGWLMIISLGAVPYFIIAVITPGDEYMKWVPDGFSYPSSLLNFRNPLHCLFESASAFTTTGLTMAEHEPSVGKGVLFYRHFSQYVGGAGFIVMALAVFKRSPGKGDMNLYGSEASGVKLRTNVIETARAIWKVYLFITFLVFIYLFLGTLIILPDYPVNNAFFDAVNHAMAGQSTGGFSTLDDSIATYHSSAMELLYIFPMIIGGLSLPFLYRFIFLRQLSQLWEDIQTRTMILVAIIGGVVLSLMLYKSAVVPNYIREGMFQFSSAMTTTGWQTSAINRWDNTSILFIVVFAMIVGGSAGGTVGGIKLSRVLLLFRGLRWQIGKIFQSDHTIKVVEFNGKKWLPDEMNHEVSQAGIFTFIYLIILVLSTLIAYNLMWPEYRISDAFFETASAQGTVGLSVGITNPSMSPWLESLYILLMWVGRIEIIPMLVLIRVFIAGVK